MGLLSTLAGLPLAPLKGLVALARQIQQQADQDRERDLAELQAELLALQLRADEQELRGEELLRSEAALLESIGVLAGARGEVEGE